MSSVDFSSRECSSGKIIMEPCKKKARESREGLLKQMLNFKRNALPLTKSQSCYTIRSSSGYSSSEFCLESFTTDSEGNRIPVGDEAHAHCCTCKRATKATPTENSYPEMPFELCSMASEPVMKSSSNCSPKHPFSNSSGLQRSLVVCSEPPPTSFSPAEANFENLTPYTYDDSTSASEDNSTIVGRDGFEYCLSCHGIVSKRVPGLPNLSRHKIRRVLPLRRMTSFTASSFFEHVDFLAKRQNGKGAVSREDVLRMEAVTVPFEKTTSSTCVTPSEITPETSKSPSRQEELPSKPEKITDSYSHGALDTVDLIEQLEEVVRTNSQENIKMNAWASNHHSPKQQHYHSEPVTPYPYNRLASPHSVRHLDSSVHSRPGHQRAPPSVRPSLAYPAPRGQLFHPCDLSLLDERISPETLFGDDFADATTSITNTPSSPTTPESEVLPVRTTIQKLQL